jgi:phage head maturation protease
MITRDQPPIGTAVRFVSGLPSSYNKTERTVSATISTGAPVKRFYGVETLEISRAAIDLSRMNATGIPVLDSHQQMGISNSVGRLIEAHVEDGALVGTMKFHDTEEGRKASGMVSRGEVTGVSAGYLVSKWEIRDEDGEIVDPERDRISWDDELTYTAKRWQLLECSLVSVSADSTAVIRSLSGTDPVAVVRERMQRRQADIDRRTDPTFAIKARMRCRQRSIERIARSK